MLPLLKEFNNLVEEAKWALMKDGGEFSGDPVAKIFTLQMQEEQGSILVKRLDLHATTRSKISIPRLTTSRAKQVNT